jgi:hypothetical protein
MVSKSEAASAREAILPQCTHKIVSPFLERYGREYEPQKLPKCFGVGRFKACYENSYRMALRHPVTYVEGMAISGAAGTFAQFHAWCVDSHGKVLDRTWKNGQLYFGVPIRTDFLKKFMKAREAKLTTEGETMYFGVLDDWTTQYSFIESFSETPELWLAD